MGKKSLRYFPQAIKINALTTNAQLENIAID